MPLLATLTHHWLKSRSSSAIFERGRTYCEQGVVEIFFETSSVVSAWVQGERRYEVVISAGAGESLTTSCTCPMGAEGDFCKHVVATALTWLNSAEEGEDAGFVPYAGTSALPPDRGPEKVAAGEEIADYLETLNADELRGWLRSAADRDDGLQSKLLFASKSRPDTPLPDILALVLWMTQVPAETPWGEQEGPSYGEELLELADLLDRRIAYGDVQLIPLIEQAISRVDEALSLFEDRDGEVGTALSRFHDIHARACEQLQPEPVELAERLFRLENSGERWPAGKVLARYRAALGEAGLARYESLVRQAWACTPALLPGESEYPWCSQNGNLQAAMESLAAEGGSVDELVRVKEKNLSCWRHYQDIATLYRDAGSYGEALAWVERGMQELPESQASSLRSFAIEEYVRAGNHARVEELAWNAFLVRPAHGYRELIAVASKIGRAAELRKRATDKLREMMAAEEGKGPGRYVSKLSPARTALVEIYLHENEASKMWTAFSKDKVAPYLHKQVAEVRGRTHPEGAIRIYLDMLGSLVEAGAKHANYRDAADVVGRIRALRAEHDKLDEFAKELATIRATWKNRRNFMKLLVAMG